MFTSTYYEIFGIMIKCFVSSTKESFYVRSLEVAFNQA